MSGDGAAAGPPAPGFSAPRWWRAVVQGLAGLVTAAVVAFAVVAAVRPHLGPDRPPTGTPADAVGAVLVTVGAMLLVWRGRRPLAVFGAEAVLATLDAALGARPALSAAIVLMVLSLYMVASLCDPARTIAVAAVGALAVGAAGWAVASTTSGYLSFLVHEAALLTAAVAVGIAVRSQRALLHGFQERAEQAEREQRWGSARAVATERVRIARELHDVVAHHVSLLVVQAGAVRETLPPDHVTRPVLDSMIGGGRRAMGELRDMLGALRLDERGDGPDDEVAGTPPWVPDGSRHPQPGVADLAGLVAGARTGGLPVTLQIEGPAVELSEATGVSVYRVVQESLTNALKHAPGAFTTVRLTYLPGRLDVSVANGPSPARTLPGQPVSSHPAGSAPPAGRHGLVGMAERVALAHGRLDVGPQRQGWAVLASFPLGTEPPVVAAGTRAGTAP